MWKILEYCGEDKECISRVLKELKEHIPEHVLDRVREILASLVT